MRMCTVRDFFIEGDDFLGVQNYTRTQYGPQDSFRVRKGQS